MAWLQLELEINQTKVEALLALLEQFDVMSVTLTAASHEPLFHTKQHTVNEPQDFWQKTRVTVLLHPDADRDIVLVCVQDCIGTDNIYQHKFAWLQDKDWVSECKAAHQPLFFSNRICISPSWCDQQDHDIPTLILDPGCAFGTGTHPTTALCIEWLATNDLANKIVIDYGCGSGILAMVAARLGAKTVYAVDIDEHAIQFAKDNISRNNLADKIVIGHVDNVSLPDTDILLANILMRPLQALSDTFSRLTKTAGHIVLSGLLRTQAEACLATYAPCFNMDKPVFSAEWIRLHGSKI